VLHHARVAIGCGPRPGTSADRGAGNVALHRRDEGGELRVASIRNGFVNLGGWKLYIIKRFEGRWISQKGEWKMLKREKRVQVAAEMLRLK
jgi:hypothetical protein